MKQTNYRGSTLLLYRMGIDHGYNASNPEKFYSWTQRRVYNKGYKLGIKLYKKHLKMEGLNE